MKQNLTPYDLHVGDWVYVPNKTDNIFLYFLHLMEGEYRPVCINAIYADIVGTTDGGRYGFDELSPIPFDPVTAMMFDWTERLTLHVNWFTKEPFFRYMTGSRRIREKHGLTTIHEIQQWFFQTFHEPLRLTLLEAYSIPRVDLNALPMEEEPHGQEIFDRKIP